MKDSSSSRGIPIASQTDGDGHDRSHAMPSVTVTIVNHQARDLLRECLRSLQQHPYTLGPMDIVVLDNASRDGSTDMLHDEFPDVIVLEQDLRRGFGANQNIAVTASRGEAVFILNPDVVVGTGTIDALVRAVWSADRVVAAGCPTLYEDGTPRQGHPNRFPTPLSVYSKALGLGRFSKSHRPSSDVFDDRWLSGGALLIDREAFVAIGGFDEDFFMYAEDVDLCARLRAAGSFFAWVPDVAVVHPLPDESREAMQRRSLENTRGEFRYMRKHHGAIGLYVYRLGAILDSMVRVVALTLPGISRSVSVHGGTVENTKTMHLSRLRSLVQPSTGEGLREFAGAWNTHHARKASPSASEGTNDSPKS